MNGFKNALRTIFAVTVLMVGGILLAVASLFAWFTDEKPVRRL